MDVFVAKIRAVTRNFAAWSFLRPCGPWGLGTLSMKSLRPERCFFFWVGGVGVLGGLGGLRVSGVWGFGVLGFCFLFLLFFWGGTRSASVMLLTCEPQLPRRAAPETSWRPADELCRTLVYGQVLEPGASNECVPGFLPPPRKAFLTVFHLRVRAAFRGKLLASCSECCVLFCGLPTLYRQGFKSHHHSQNCQNKFWGWGTPLQKKYTHTPSQRKAPRSRELDVAGRLGRFTEALLGLLHGYGELRQAPRWISGFWSGGGQWAFVKLPLAETNMLFNVPLLVFLVGCVFFLGGGGAGQ